VKTWWLSQRHTILNGDVFWRSGKRVLDPDEGLLNMVVNGIICCSRTDTSRLIKVFRSIELGKVKVYNVGR